MTVPAVSVVIPTHNRREPLGQVLQALAEQSLPADKLEVLVVADGCTDGTEASLRQPGYPFELVVLSQPASGAATARNRGAAAARADLLLFLDDDVVLGRDAVAAHLQHHAEHPGTVGVGPYLLGPPERRSLLLETRARWWEKQFDRIADDSQPPSYEDLLPGNLSISRTLYQEVGGFSTAFRCWGSEDYEFGVRLIKAGYRMMLVPHARARHLQTLSLESDYRNMWSSGGTSVIFARLHPDIAPTLWLAESRRVDWLAEHLPRVCDGLARACLRLLVILDRTGPRRTWRWLHGNVRRYAYWRGAQEESRRLDRTDPYLAAEPPSR